MHIETVSLTDFRNYERLDFKPVDGLNILVGSNGQGKSAILEAVYLLATSKSHRTSRDIDLIRLGQENARACAKVIRSANNDVTVEIILSRAEKKTVKLNTVKHPKVGDIIGQLNAVIFSNSDIDMVRGEPSLRRRFLNLEISQIAPQYVYALGRYKRVLDQRNNLLREMKMSGRLAGGLEVWDSQLTEYGASVIARRAKFIEFLSAAAARLYALLTDSAEELSVSYKPNVNASGAETEGEVREEFAKLLAARREVDMARGTTTVGPHRDDIILNVNGIAAREYASQGQQRTAAIAMKLAEIEIMEESAGESPVVLLDDVMAELDDVRRARILDVTQGRCQTFITTTTLDQLGDTAVGLGSVFEVRSGKVTQK
ncbi:MAG: DNA replication/repair protein RecF [Armatimonadetes bacterium]|nr:DNA replication/repair protein RecF [Armatimonadota bacterium]